MAGWLLMPTGKYLNKWHAINAKRVHYSRPSVFYCYALFYMYGEA
jgi:hypothetical protein